MSIKDVIQLVLEILAGLGILAGGVGYLVRTFGKDGREDKNEILSSADKLTQFWKEQAEGYKIVMTEKDKSNDDKFLTLNKELGEIRGQLLEKEKQNKAYLDILQNRDPETKKFMELMIDFAEKQTTTNKAVAQILESIHTMVKEEHEKDLKISSTVSRV